MVFKALHRFDSEYIMDIFTKVSDSHTRNLRLVDDDLLLVLSSKCNFYENLFTISVGKMWNEVPLDIRHSSSLPLLKISLRAYLLNKWVFSVFRKLHNLVVKR